MQPDCRCTRDEPFLLFMYATSGVYAMPILKSGIYLLPLQWSPSSG